MRIRMTYLNVCTFFNSFYFIGKFKVNFKKAYLLNKVILTDVYCFPMYGFEHASVLVVLSVETGH